MVAMAASTPMARRAWIVGWTSLALGVAMFLHALLYSDGWRNRARAQADLEALRGRNAAAEARVADLRSQIESMRSRPEAQERAVRHQLGWVRQGEIVLELGDP